MKKQFSFFEVTFFCTIILIAISCKDISSQNYHSLPQRPLIEDSISAPVFKGGLNLFKTIMSTELSKVYKRENMIGYSRIYFSFKVDSNGIAKEQFIVNTTENVEKKFGSINNSLFEKIKNWEPARRKDNNTIVEYTLRIEVESFGNRLKLSLMNNDLRRLFEEDL